MAGRKVNILIKDVHFDEELYPRSGYNWQTGYDYSQSMNTGAIFPRIILALLNKKYYLVDGKHRLEATKILHRKSINALVYTGWNKRKIFEQAIQCNISHGRVLSPYEKRMIALKLRKMKYGNANISKMLQIPTGKLEKFVANRIINTITGEEIVKSGLKNLAGQQMTELRMEQINNSQKPMYISSQLSLLEQLTEILEKGMLDTGNEDVMRLIEDLKSLLDKY